MVVIGTPYTKSGVHPPVFLWISVFYRDPSLDKCVRIHNYGILTERICMLFIVPVVLLNVLGVMFAVIGQPLLGFAFCAVSFLYIAKQFID